MCVCLQVVKGIQRTCKFNYIHILILMSVQSILILILLTFFESAIF